MRCNAERFPYEQIWHAAELNLFGKSFQFEIAGDFNKSQCTVTFKDKEIFLTTADEVCSKFRYAEAYISDVVTAPKKYIDNPALVDWSWLQFSQEKGCDCKLMQIAARKFT